MTRICLIPLLALAAALPAWGAGTAARVDLTSRAPLTVHGTGFRAGEHVVVRVSTSKRYWKKTVLARARGGFWAKFTADITEYCDSVTIVATGDRGSRAVRKTPLPMCPQPAPGGP